MSWFHDSNVRVFLSYCRAGMVKFELVDMEVYFFVCVCVYVSSLNLIYL